LDRVIKKSKWNRRRILTIGGIAAIVLLIASSIYFTSGKSSVNEQIDRMTISEVTKGPFQESIAQSGVVLPITTIYLDAVEGGRVEEVYVEDGTVMQKDQPILRLSNTDLELDLANRQTSVFDVLTQMQLTKNQAQENTIQKLNQEADVDNALAEAKRIYLLDSVLNQQKAIATQDFQSAKNAYQYQLQRKILADQTLKADSSTTQQELAQANESYQSLQSALALMKEKVGDLIVRAPVAGQLTSLDAEVGETKINGDRLGQIDVLSGYKIRADIDEHYITRIFTGLTGDFTIGDSTYKVKVKKVYTQVVNNTFQVDLSFVGKVPSNIRRGQTLQLRLALSDETQAVLLPRGGFFEQTGGNWIFKLDPSGTKAYRVNIQLGRQDPDYYEVLSGLSPGDKVVTSGYENFGDMQELVLKK
jgi:HlyD family secretion protein